MIFDENRLILIKYHAIFVIFERDKILNCRLLQNIGGALALGTRDFMEKKDSNFRNSLHAEEFFMLLLVSADFSSRNSLRNTISNKRFVS